MDMVIIAIGDESMQLRIRLMRLHIAAMDLSIPVPPIEPFLVMELRSLMEDTIMWSDVEEDNFKVRKKPNWTRDYYMSSGLSDARAQAFLARQQVRTTRRSGSRHRERPRILLEASV